MNISSVLTNDFRIRYDENRRILQITTIHGGKPASVPIELHLSMLLDMNDPKEACRWFGETILLLIPELRTNLFKLPPES